MSKYSDRIQEILKNASSKKIMNKRKCVTELLELYDNREAVNEICKNTAQSIQGVVNWSYIMHTVHKLLLNEAERLACKDSSSKATVIERQNTCAVVLKTVQIANSGMTPLLKCGDLMPLVFQILNTRIYESYHDTYIAILVTQILPIRMYQVNISPDQWKELIKICTVLYKYGSSSINKRNVLEALQMIVDYGSLHSDLLLDVKKMLPFLESVFIDVKANQEILLESACKLANTVCRRIAIECRIALSEMSENILPNVISLNSSVEKYELLLLFVQIHHPKGVSSVNDGAYAHDWTKWNRILKSMYLMILRDSKPNILPKSFIHLASEVVKQILEHSDLILEIRSSDEYDYLHPKKRRRIATKINGLVDMITDNNPQEAWPIIQIFTVLLEKYPECLKSQDFTNFLKTLVDLLAQSCAEEIILGNLYELAAVLLRNEKLLSTDMENENVYWEKIWDVLLRSLNMNQNVTSVHTLAQVFIINNKVMNPNGLLRLYLTNVIKWSPISLRTLLIFCECQPLPSDVSGFNINVCSSTMTSNSVKSCLLKWILNIPWQKMTTKIVVDDLCSVLVSIILKSWYIKELKFDKYDTNDVCNCSHKATGPESVPHKHIEHCYLLLTYKINLFTEQKDEGVQQGIKMNDNILCSQDLLVHLINLICDVNNECGESNDLCMIIMKTTVIAKFTSLLKQLNIISGDIEKSLLVCTMKKYLEHAYSLLANMDLLRNKYIYIFNITKALNVLYKTSYDVEIAKIIVSCTTLGMLKNIFNLMNIEDRDITDYQVSNNYYDYNTFQGRRKRSDNEASCQKYCTFCNEGIIKTQTTKALTLLCCMNVGREKFDIQVKIMRNLLATDLNDFSRTVDFKIAMIVLESLIEYGKEELARNHKDVPLKVLLGIHKQCYKDETAMRYILNVLPFFLDYAIKYSYEVKDLINVISQFHIHLLEKKYGFVAHIEFIKCLSKVAQIDPSFSWSTLHDDTNQTIPIVEKILISLNSTLCIVRLQAIQSIQEIYSIKNIDFKWKQKFFEKIEESVNKLFVIDRQLEENEKTDERDTRLASALLVLTAVIYTSGTLQCHALLAMIRLTVDKQIESETVRTVLCTMNDQISYKNLIGDNLHYLLSYWHNSKYASKPFPWILAHCKFQEEFYKTYINMLLLIKLQNLDITDAMALCDYVGIPFAQAIENVFPQVLSWLLYCICEKNENVRVKVASKVLHKLLSNKEEFIGVKKISVLFEEKFEGTLLYLIQRLHDEDYLQETFGIQMSLPKSNPPHFKKKSVDMCLQYIEKNFFTQGKSLQYILTSTCPNVLQKILLYLISYIYKKQFLEHKIKAFHQYIYFCALIIQEMKENYFDTLSKYIIKDIGYSLLHLIQANEDILSELACKYLYTFFKSILPTRSEEVKEILNFTVMTLNSVVQAGRMPMALKVLKLLIINQKDTLHSAIEKLNSFPNLKLFEEVRSVHNHLKYKTEKTYSLEKEIQHFLNASNNKNISCSFEDISHLKFQLSTRKEELRKIYIKLEALHGFAEDCVSSVLHQLIHRLIQLTGSYDKKVSVEAAKCLGELGPTELTTMILYLEKSHVKETLELVGILTYKAVTLMTEFLFQSDIKLREASSNALCIVLSSPWGQKLLNAQYVERIKTELGESQMNLCLDYIQPFIVKTISKTIHITLNVEVNNIMNPNNAIWSGKSDGLYAEWIIEITCGIAKCFSGFYAVDLIQLCKLSTDFCELILPRLIFLIIHIDRNLLTATCLCINQFFDYHFNPVNERVVSLHTMQKGKSCDHQIVHCMLNIVNYIRIQITDMIPLKLNYMHIARAAQYCSAFYTAILYAEISCENTLSDNHNFISISKIDYICELDLEQGKMIQSILRDAYLKIGDPDAIYGSGSLHLQDHSTRMQHYIHTRKWDKVMLAQDVELAFGNTTVIREMATGLHESGLENLLGHFISIMSKSGEKVDEDVQYECAWRLSNWNLCESNHALHTRNDYNLKSQITESSYHFYHYQALKCFHESNEIGVQNAIENAHISIIKSLRKISLESSKTVYKKLMQLQLLREIEELSCAKADEYTTILHKWQQYDITNANEFQYIEPILTQRAVMYQITDALSNNSNIKDALTTTYLEIAKIAANQENLNIAARSLAVLAKQKDLSPGIQDQLLYQESLLAWLNKESEIGRFLLRSLILKETLDPNLRAQVLRVYGDWMAETKSENPQAVIKKYYLESINTSMLNKEQTIDVIKNLHDTQVALARFADAQYNQISSYMKSPQFEGLKECVTYSSKGINIDSTSRDQDLRRAVIINQRQNTNDTEELEHIHREKNNYLILALRYYLITLQRSEDYNLLIFRIIALWLDNMYHEEVNKLLSTELDRIPSFKFISLVPQLAAHMSNNTDEFSAKIYKIMERCALEHPHHTLPVLLALKNLYGDHEYNIDKRNKKVKEEARILGAKKLLEHLKKSNVGPIVYEMDKLSHALVMLANYQISTSKSKGVCNKVPKDQEILKIINFENVLVSTLTIDVQSSRNYNDVIGIFKYLKTYETVGGIRAPKKVFCVGTDGIHRAQLVKGKDDLRQDAVMQQVFNVMNTLLKTCKETKRRKLLIRTYKVVPLTQRSGILEWCDNTIPIVTVLIGSNSVPGLHQKYYPDDYRANVCKEKIAAVTKSSNEVKLKVFTECCSRMHPALHHFFTERYPSPETWFERRLAYTRSVATTSMAGYILGLGDRHLSNILIDQITAEVIHIDFGIAFEQGKVLPIPETVPFRLTRNVEAAMGVSGIEGTMRRCCEKTLTVLRDQRQVIITLLQVLLYDPLFTWAITPAKAYKIQSDNSSKTTEINQGCVETNKTAERALLRIEQKLQGTEEGLVSSISGQVERLIQQARDPSNLCRLYCGWQAYL